jgi:hypothetical protein
VSLAPGPCEWLLLRVVRNTSTVTSAATAASTDALMDQAVRRLDRDFPGRWVVSVLMVSLRRLLAVSASALLVTKGSR